MSNRQIAIIVVAVLVAGVGAAVGPTVVSEYQQRARDDTVQCAMWRAHAALLDLRTMTPKGVSYAELGEHERKRRRLGCSGLD